MSEPPKAPEDTALDELAKKAEELRLQSLELPEDPEVHHHPWGYSVFVSGSPILVSSDKPDLEAFWDECVARLKESAKEDDGRNLVLVFPEALIDFAHVQAVASGWVMRDDEDDEGEYGEELSPDSTTSDRRSWR